MLNSKLYGAILDLTNKVAIVTGASRGIGKSIALALAEEGAHLALIARNEQQLQDVKSQVESHGVNCFTFTGDLTEESTIKKFISSTLSQFNRIDILVNNAGIGHFGPVSELSTNAWDEMFNLNMRALFLMTRDCLPALRKAKESFIINIGSLAGKNAFVGGSGYAATKHALLGFSRCLMLEERKNGVRVLALCPGSVDTHFPGQPRAADDPKKARILQPEDVAASAIHVLKLPQRAMLSEIDIRPSNP